MTKYVSIIVDQGVQIIHTNTAEWPGNEIREISEKKGNRPWIGVTHSGRSRRREPMKGRKGIKKREIWSGGASQIRIDAKYVSRGIDIGYSINDLWEIVYRNEDTKRAIVLELASVLKRRSRGSINGDRNVSGGKWEVLAWQWAEIWESWCKLFTNYLL